MRYNQIRECDIANGEGIGIALFVQGCHFKCPGCFNSETWDFNGGKEWTEETKERFLELIDKPYIKRVSILGGEPLANENLADILDLVSEINRRYNTIQDVVLNDKNNHYILNEEDNQIRLLLPEKTIWLYTGYKIEDFNMWKPVNDYINTNCTIEEAANEAYDNLIRQVIVDSCDVLVDGRYEEDKKDINLKWCGSSNQRVIDVKKSLEQGEIVLWDTH